MTVASLLDSGTRDLSVRGVVFLVQMQELKSNKRKGKLDSLLELLVQLERRHFQVLCLWAADKKKGFLLFKSSYMAQGMDKCVTEAVLRRSPSTHAQNLIDKLILVKRRQF